MPVSFQRTLKNLLAACYQFGPGTATSKLTYLREISRLPFPLHPCLFDYHQALLFTLTHAENQAVLRQAEAALRRFTGFLKKNAHHELFTDSGLPYTTMLTRFTQDAFNDLAANSDVTIRLESLNNPAFDLNRLLNITLPQVLKEYTTAEMPDNDLLETLGVNPGRAFEFLLGQVNDVEAPPLVKDLLWQSLQSFFYITGKNKNYSKSYNRMLLQPYFFHTTLLKQLDQREWLAKKIPGAARLSDGEKARLASVIRNSMPLAMREIDTITYMDTGSLQVFHLESGLSLALYTAVPERQLPMQSFVGYSLFKNAYPVSYGGSWIFGGCSLFGLNILDEFRGGESKFIMTQILRVYIQLYHISYYEIEPFQFGNKEALSTGAFWFYYKYGFRSKDEAVNLLAEREYKKIKARKGYKTSLSVLKKLSAHPIALQLGKQKPVHREDILDRMNHLIAVTYKGNSRDAIRDAKNYCCTHFPLKRALSAAQQQVFEEVALWAFAHKIQDRPRLELLHRIIFTKGADTVAYNQLVLQVIALS